MRTMRADSEMSGSKLPNIASTLNFALQDFTKISGDTLALWEQGASLLFDR